MIYVDRLILPPLQQRFGKFNLIRDPSLCSRHYSLNNETALKKKKLTRTPSLDHLPKLDLGLDVFLLHIFKYIRYILHLWSVNTEDTSFVIFMDDVVPSYDGLISFFELRTIPKSFDRIDHLSFRILVVMFVNRIFSVKER